MRVDRCVAETRPTFEPDDARMYLDLYRDADPEDAFDHFEGTPAVLHMRGGPGVAIRPRLGGRLLRISEVVDRAISATLKEHAWKAKRASHTEPLRRTLTYTRSAI
jgi:hypothetical protein